MPSQALFTIINSVQLVPVFSTTAKVIKNEVLDFCSMHPSFQRMGGRKEIRG